MQPNSMEALWGFLRPAANAVLFFLIGSGTAAVRERKAAQEYVTAYKEDMKEYFNLFRAAISKVTDAEDNAKKEILTQRDCYEELTRASGKLCREAYLRDKMISVGDREINPLQHHVHICLHYLKPTEFNKLTRKRVKDLTLRLDAACNSAAILPGVARTALEIMSYKYALCEQIDAFESNLGLLNYSSEIKFSNPTNLTLDKVADNFSKLFEKESALKESS